MWPKITATVCSTNNMKSNLFLLVIFTVPFPLCSMLSEILLDDLLLSGAYYTEHVFYSVL